MLIPDVNVWHTVKDWSSAKKQCSFIISKATQGTTKVDSTLDKFITGCESNKIPYWLYCYLENGNEAKQVEFMVNTCKNKVGKYFIGYCVDIEAGNTESGALAALKKVESYGTKCMIYTGYRDREKYKNVVNKRSANTAWWQAIYGKNNGVYSPKYPCSDGVDLHQFTDQGYTNFVNGNVDLNRLTGTKPLEWFTTAKKSSTPTTTQTQPVPAPTKNIPALAKYTLRYGSKGEQAKLLQKDLNYCGYSLVVDGDFGSKTLTALKSWQGKNKLSVDGIYGPKSYEAMRKSLK